nr:unnamed protein product [Digitaria exilis]
MHTGDDVGRSALTQCDKRRRKLHAPLAAAAAANDGLLPADILHEVLLRLPTDELCRLRLVCRSWRSLTSDPIFAKAHSSRHPLLVGINFLVGHGREVQFVDTSGNILR